ncbi:MAG: hypothetical protein H7Z40_23660 [Phycisphaerae bacterium]|nr:hypothetical protein [Gemmatimonadaceae bacterium]
MTDPSLRAAYRAAVERAAPPNRAGCPSADKLGVLAASTNVGASQEHGVMLDHVLSCAHCRPEFELLRATNAAARGETGRSRSWFTPQRIALAATMLMAVGIGGEAWRRSRTAEMRGTPVDVSDVVLVSPSSGNTAPLTARFVWRSVNGAATYQWDMLDSAGAVLVQGTTADTTAQLSATDSARLASLPFFDWMVTARRSDGNERRSALTRVRVSPSERR